MNWPDSLAFAAAVLTLAAFGGAMKYFRHADRASSLKRWLVVSIYVCALTQLVTLWLSRPLAEASVWAGVSLYLLAHVLFWWSLLVHGAKRPAFAFAAVPPASLTQSGPYRLIRHPIYTSYVIVWLAGVVAAGQPWLLLTVGWMSWFYFQAARQEEQSFAGSAFADEYQAYRRRTDMFLPRLWGRGAVVPLGTKA
jgi:protein-S-isoprenylcysteine O-methyltransferase Ste14